MPDVSPFTIESDVRYYGRKFPVTFARGQGHLLYDTQGSAYLDYLSGAGALNYGHNDPLILSAVLEYLGQGGVIQSLDMQTAAKEAFLASFQEHILVPRGLPYRVQFTGPTGSSAVEAALKLARKVTGRPSVAAFTNAYHGISLGALSVTANASKRAAAGTVMPNVIRLPYAGYCAGAEDSLAMARSMLVGPGCGNELPAAIILETIQAEGGINVAPKEWLIGIQSLSREIGALLIVDEIQTGCGRTGPFFSFEDAGLQPDIVCLSKSIGGIGLPMAVVLIRVDLDQWQPGEHNGTFRGNNLAFVAAKAAIDSYWRDREFEEGIRRKSEILRHRLWELAKNAPFPIEVRGKGLLLGLACEAVPEVADTWSGAAFGRRMIIETCGARDQVLKLLPPLSITEEGLDQGMEILHSIVGRA